MASKTPKAISVKTLDSSLMTKNDDGTTNSLSAKCADINFEMARLLGVSDPILNYVLFCHQEDSNWPLDEGSKVKQKFDEIFAAAKFNDALKHIKEVRAMHMTKLRDNTKDLEHYRENKQVANEKSKDLKKLHSNNEELENFMSGIDEQIGPLLEELRKIQEVETDFSGVQQQLAVAKSKREDIEADIERLKESLSGELGSTFHDSVRFLD